MMADGDERDMYGGEVAQGDFDDSTADHEWGGSPGRKRRRKPPGMKDDSGPVMDEVTTHPISGEEVVHVLCNAKEGMFRLQKRTLDCLCEVCREIKNIMGLEELDISPREFEYHAGMSHCKRWRSTIYLYNPAFKGNRGKTLGNWLDVTHGNEEIPHTAKVRGKHDYLIRTYAVPAGRGWGSTFADQDWDGLHLEKEYDDRRRVRVDKNGGKIERHVPMHGYAHTPDFPKSHEQPGHANPFLGTDAHGDGPWWAGPSAAGTFGGGTFGGGTFGGGHGPRPKAQARSSR